MVGRGCTFERPDGRLCGATRLRDAPFCFWHAPEREEDATEARRLGGLRRRREKTVSGAYDLAGLGSIEAIRRILEIAVLDALGLENSIARSRVLVSAAMAAAKLLETGELEARLAALEATLGTDRTSVASSRSGDDPGFGDLGL
jgi:hypothetical protein